MPGGLQVKMAGGKCVYVPLRPPDETSPCWHLCFDEFRAAFTDKTRWVHGFVWECGLTS